MTANNGSSIAEIRVKCEFAFCPTEQGSAQDEVCQYQRYQYGIRQARHITITARSRISATTTAWLSWIHARKREKRDGFVDGMAINCDVDLVDFTCGVDGSLGILPKVNVLRQSPVLYPPR